MLSSVVQDPNEGHIQVVIPHWIYRKMANFLVGIRSLAKPEDYISAILEGHIRRLNL